MEIEWKKHIAEIDPMNGDCTLINDDVLLWAENRMNELQALVEMSSAHVFASAGAEHMLDGFKPKRRPIDELVERIKAVMPNVDTTGATRQGKEQEK